MCKRHVQDQFSLAHVGLPDHNPECQAPAALDAVPSHQWLLRWVVLNVRQAACSSTPTHPHSCVPEPARSKKDATQGKRNTPHQSSGKGIFLVEEFTSIRKPPLII